MRNRKRNSRRGWLKGIPKKRTVFGRRRVGDDGRTFVVEMKTDGLHVRQIRGNELMRVVPFQELIRLSVIQIELIAPVSGSSLALPVGAVARPKEQKGHHPPRSQLGASRESAGDSFPADGEGEPKQKRAVTETKESKDIYGSIQKGTTEGPEGHPNP